VQQVQPGAEDDQEAPTTDFYSSHNKYAAGEQSDNLSVRYRGPSVLWHRDRNGALLPDRDESDYYHGRGKDGELCSASLRPALAACRVCHGCS